jgi:hypothetical protein
VSDQYTRVSRLPHGSFGEAADRYLVDDPDGRMKVVPTDAIVIERGDLPPVTTSRVAQGWVNAGPYDGNPRGGDIHYRPWALAYLALDEYLAAHPPVDEARVRALASDLALAMGIPNDSDAVARVLVGQGWTRQQVTP